jgi:hypothetical protein
MSKSITTPKKRVSKASLGELEPIWEKMRADADQKLEEARNPVRELEEVRATYRRNLRKWAGAIVPAVASI